MAVDIQGLVSEGERAIREAQRIVREAKLANRPLGAEEKTTLDRLILAHQNAVSAVESSQEVERKTLEIDKLAEFYSKPDYKVPRPGSGNVGDGETDTHKAFKSMGWEIKSVHGIETVYAPTMEGKLVAYAPAEIFFGDVDPREDPKGELKAYYMAQRAIFAPNYRKTWLNWIKLGAKHKDPAIAFAMLSGDEQKALSEGTDTLGGFLVPPDIQAEMLQRIPMASVMEQLCRVVPTSRDILAFPMITPNATTGAQSSNGSIFTGGFVGDWAGETPAFTDVNPGIGSFPVAVRKARAATKISNDLLADAVFPFLAFLSQDGSRNLGLVQDNGFIAGQTTYFTNGAGTAANAAALQPLGLLAAVAASSGTGNNIDVTGNTAHTISNDLTHIGSTTLIPAVQANLPQQYQPSAQWLMHRLTELHIRQLTDTTGRFIFAPGYLAPVGQAGEQFDTLQGKKLNRSDFVPKDGTANNPCIIYGDFSHYIIARRAGISTTILRERFADTDQTGIILWSRVGGACWNTDGFRFGTVT